MTKAFDYLLEHAPSLGEFLGTGKDLDDTLRAMVRRMGTASSGEKCMIAAAISLVPSGWLPEDLDAPAFRLSDTSSLDAGNTRALVAAIAVAAEHPEVLRR